MDGTSPRGRIGVEPRLISDRLKCCKPNRAAGIWAKLKLNPNDGSTVEVVGIEAKRGDQSEGQAVPMMMIGK
jgi:hypothetical protein